MARAISVKVSRTKIIEALQNKLEEMAKQKAIYEENQKNYEMNYEMWKSAVAQIAYANFDITKANKRNVIVRNWGNEDTTRVEVEVHIDNDKLPEEPKRPSDPYASNGYGRNFIGNYDDRVAEITNAIKILQLSEEEVVSTSTYQSVSRYL